MYEPLVDCLCLSQSFPGLAAIRSMMRNNCLTLSNANKKPVKGEGETLLEVRGARRQT